jgi:type VI secretion system protein ImpK
MAHVRELFSPLIAYVLLFEQTVQQGELQPAYEQVRGTISNLLRQQEAEADGLGILKQDFQDARFAVVAWTDERVLNNRAWEHYSRWRALPLQFELYQTRNAGEEFFERLERLRADQQEIREVYYVCLGLGFRGMYGHPEDEPRLHQIRQEQVRHLPMALEDVPKIDKLTAQPYQASAPGGKPIKPPLSHLLLKVGLALLVIVPLGLLLGYWIWPGAMPARYQLIVAKAGSGSGTVTSTPAGIDCGTNCSATYAGATEVTLQAAPDPTSLFGGWSGDADCADGVVVMTGKRACTATFDLKPPPPPSDDEMKRELAQRLAGLECAKISVEVRAGVVELAGRIPDEEQRARARALVQGRQGVTRIHEAFTVIPRPFCEVLELLEPVKEQAERQGFGLAASLKKLQKDGVMALTQAVEAVYVRDEKLVVEVKTPSAFTSYVYVDYYTADGGVSHLFPNPVEKKHLFPPNSTLTLGQPGAPLQWEILPPFGLELVTVIASKAPLFSLAKYDPQPARGYLAELRQALSADGGRAEIAATFQFITTQDRR